MCWMSSKGFLQVWSQLHWWQDIGWWMCLRARHPCSWIEEQSFTQHLCVDSYRLVARQASLSATMLLGLWAKRLWCRKRKIAFGCDTYLGVLMYSSLYYLSTHFPITALCILSSHKVWLCFTSNLVLAGWNMNPQPLDQYHTSCNVFLRLWGTV